MDRVCRFEVPYNDKQRMVKFCSGVYAQVCDCEDNVIGLWQPLHG